ncbi:MAG: PEP-CTERM sorting domain-containing protein [Fimbriimonadaceae bacterium]
MNNKFKRVGLMLVGMSMVVAANAQVKLWNWNGQGANNGGGTINAITASFNTVTNRLTWRANFGNVPGTSAKTDGFHLVLSPGANPKGHAGELAILYFDATGGSPKLTAYNYNGFNGNSSYYDGSPQSGNQTPDRIKSSVASLDWVNSLTVTNEANGTRTLGFDIDATALNIHNPLYPGNSPWTGAAFGDKLGVWFHTYSGLNTTYSNNGYLSSLSRQCEGWLDLNDQTTQSVPEPASMAALGLGIAAVLRRRKKA